MFTLQHQSGLSSNPYVIMWRWLDVLLFIIAFWGLFFFLFFLEALHFIKTQQRRAGVSKDLLIFHQVDHRCVSNSKAEQQALAAGMKVISQTSMTDGFWPLKAFSHVSGVLHAVSLNTSSCRHRERWGSGWEREATLRGASLVVHRGFFENRFNILHARPWFPLSIHNSSGFYIITFWIFHVSNPSPPSPHPTLSSDPNRGEKKQKN